MNVRDVMVRSVSVCRLEDNLAEVAATMWENRCGVLPVLEPGGAVASMITDRDICIALGTRNVRASELHVSDVSLPGVFTCRAEDDVRSALKTMVFQNVRRLPVVDDADKLAGIVSIDDVLRCSEARPSTGGVSSAAAVGAVKAILEQRVQGRMHEPAELVAAHA